MSKVNRKAFKVLSEDEKASLALQQMHGKSTWQAGEIMKKSHYKYLEINQRAKKYLEMFQVHYNTFNNLIPQDLNLNPIFEEFIIQVIENRKKVKQAVTDMVTKDTEWLLVKKTRDKFLTEHIRKLATSSKYGALELLRILLDFDRYNNFRILPPDVQEPSAFKRRNKTRFKKHLTTSLTLPIYTNYRIRDLYGAKKAKNPGYIILAPNGEKPEVVLINTTKDAVEILSSISIYIFQSEQTANDYKELVEDYLSLVKNSPREGLKFWPKYRTIIREAFNFSEVNNIIPSRKHILTSLKLMDIKDHNERANIRLTRALTKDLNNI